MYDGTIDHFDHYHQVITLDIGDNALLCKVFPTNLYSPTLVWFHQLAANPINDFRELSKVFVEHHYAPLDRNRASVA